MTELNRASIERILAEEAARKEQIESGIETVSQILEEKAKRVYGAFEEERHELFPEAQTKLDAVVIPWWQEFEESGLYDKIFRYLSESEFGSGIDPVAFMTEPIVFPWLRISINPKDITRFARSILQDQKGDIEKAQQTAANAYESHYVWRNTWTARVYVAGEHQHRYKSGFGIARWPIDGGGFAFAMNADSYAISLHPNDADQLLARAHPEILPKLVTDLEVYRGRHFLDQKQHDLLDYAVDGLQIIIGIPQNPDVA